MPTVASPRARHEPGAPDGMVPKAIGFNSNLKLGKSQRKCLEKGGPLKKYIYCIYNLEGEGSPFKKTKLGGDWTDVLTITQQTKQTLHYT